MAMFYYRKATLGMGLAAMVCTETGSTLMYYRQAAFSAYGL